jgi:D-glycero-alpha-D-manno-heptose-7-phosphate kinase
MIISRTPYRISFFGGGTDYPAWYRNHGGAVLATTIDKYCYLTCRYLPPFFEHRIRLVYSRIESVQRAVDLSHPAVREIIGFLGLDRGLEIHHDGDLPARSGMGSSSAFTVGLLNGLYALQGRMPSKQQLARESIHVEQDLLKENVGSQDQVLAAYGGLNHVLFLPNGEISVRPITIPAERLRALSAHLMLLYTGIKRTASEVANSFVHDLGARKRQLRIMKDLVDEGISILTGGQDLTAFGELLHEAWQAKRSMSASISNQHVDALYAEALAAGAVGGKLTGAGGGGFLLLFVSPDRQAAVRQRLARFIHVPIALEFSGSQIVFFEPEADYSAEEQARAEQTIQAFRELEEAMPAELTA